MKICAMSKRWLWLQYAFNGWSHRWKEGGTWNTHPQHFSDGLLCSLKVLDHLFYAVALLSIEYKLHTDGIRMALLLLLLLYLYGFNDTWHCVAWWYCIGTVAFWRAGNILLIYGENSGRIIEITLIAEWVVEEATRPLDFISTVEWRTNAVSVAFFKIYISSNLVAYVCGVDYVCLYECMHVSLRAGYCCLRAYHYLLDISFWCKQKPLSIYVRSMWVVLAYINACD